MKKPGDTTYTAWYVTPAEGEDDAGVTIVVDRYAGICGPGQVTPKDSPPANLAAADAWLHSKGFHRVEDWQLSDSHHAGQLYLARLTDPR